MNCHKLAVDKGFNEPRHIFSVLTSENSRKRHDHGVPNQFGRKTRSRNDRVSRERVTPPKSTRLEAHDCDATSWERVTEFVTHQDARLPKDHSGTASWEPLPQGLPPHRRTELLHRLKKKFRCDKVSSGREGSSWERLRWIVSFERLAFRLCSMNFYELLMSRNFLFRATFW